MTTDISKATQTRGRKMFYVFHHDSANGRCRIESKHRTRGEARDECARLNCEQQEANGGRSVGHYWTTDAETSGKENA